MKKLKGKTIFNISVVVMSILLFVYFCWSENGLTDLIHNIADFNKGWLFMAILFHLINMFIDIYLIYKFTKSFAKEYSFKQAFKTSMIGQFFSAVTPGASGGQPMQLYCMSKQGIDAGISTAALMQKFLVYQTTLTAYSALSIIVRFNFFNNTLNKFMWLVAVFGFAAQGLVIGLILLFSLNSRFTSKVITYSFNLLAKLHIIKNPEDKSSSLEKSIEGFHNGSKTLYRNKPLLVETFLLTIIQLTCIFIVPYCIYRSFYLSDARIIDMICSQAFVSMTSCFVPIPGASGASEGSFFIFFSNFFSDKTIKPAILLWRIITYYLTILISAPFSKLGKKRSKSLDNAVVAKD